VKEAEETGKSPAASGEKCRDFTEKVLPLFAKSGKSFRKKRQQV
jgi:hypothetical protein